MLGELTPSTEPVEGRREVFAGKSASAEQIGEIDALYTLDALETLDVECKVEGVKAGILTKRTFYKLVVSGSSLGVLRVVSR